MPKLEFLLTPVPRYWAKLRRISDFRVSGQSVIRISCHKSRSSDGIHMKLEPVTKLETRNKTTSEQFDNDVMSGNCDVILI